jgi:hypothetical protein
MICVTVRRKIEVRLDIPTTCDVESKAEERKYLQRACVETRDVGSSRGPCARRLISGTKNSGAGSPVAPIHSGAGSPVAPIHSGAGSPVAPIHVPVPSQYV